MTAAEEAPVAARMPADIEREDVILGPFTTRQTVLLGAGGLLLYGGFWALRAWMSPLAYLAMVTPITGVLLGLALGRREGISLDRFALAAVAHARTAKRRVYAPEGVPELPAFLDRALARQDGPLPVPADLPCRGVTVAGLLDLGREGTAAVACCSTVPLELRSTAEQQALAAGFGRWLNALTGPAQILLRCQPVDLEPAADHLRRHAAALSPPALREMANAHAAYLSGLSRHGQPLARQALLIVREPGTTPAARARAGQRVAEAVRLLAAAEVDCRPLGALEAAEVLHAACNPEPPDSYEIEQTEEAAC